MVLVWVCLGVCAPAFGHDLGVRHRAIGTVSAADSGLSVSVMMMMEVRQGARAERLMARFDVNRSGALEPVEAQALASELGAEAVGGFVLRFEGKAAAPAGIEAKAATTREGGLMVALLMRYTLPATKGRVEMAVLASTPTRIKPSPVSIELQAEGSVAMVASSAPPAADAAVIGPMELKPGGAGAWIEVAPPQHKE